MHNMSQFFNANYCHPQMYNNIKFSDPVSTNVDEMDLTQII